ncbi:FAD-dependent oxidoreductase [Corynebacterium frankenforstense]|uniref:FAD-dependent oxidoreductase n=1 Tax=Corynebacterium frankenforstense TaxID=1230998 RepID=UPI002551A569|nr:FAD-dependent oxidoreductase [Corynebacterium frankenforstense]MDK6259733.1 FAD-dependent oxidoreductase [Corynebacterium frankenforstense]
MFVECGALSIVPVEGRSLRTLSDYAEKFGLDYEILGRAEMARRFPQHVLRDGEVGFFDPSGGFLRTDLAVNDAVEDACRNGAEVVNDPVSGVSTRGEAVALSVGDRVEMFDRVIVSAGAWGASLLPKLAGFSSPRRVLMTWFQARSHGFSPAAFPVFSRTIGGLNVYGAPALDGRHVKISGLVPHKEVDFAPGGLDFDSSASVEELREAGTIVGSAMRGVSKYPVRATGYPDLYTSDRDFLFDWVDSSRSVLVVGGLSGKGFKMSCGLGKRAARTVLEEDVLDDSFSLSRFAV